MPNFEKGVGSKYCTSLPVPTCKPVRYYYIVESSVTGLLRFTREGLVKI
jgi:hypothetical protein